MIENTITGEWFETTVLPVATNEIKKAAWLFNWKAELTNSEKQVYKLTTKENPKVLQGLVSISDEKDHIFLHLVENARFNRGKDKLYNGVALNLFAFACKLSFEAKYDGVVAFVSKTALREYYVKLLAAKIYGANRLFIDTPQAVTLVQNYFKDFNF